MGLGHVYNIFSLHSAYYEKIINIHVYINKDIYISSKDTCNTKTRKNGNACWGHVKEGLLSILTIGF